MHVLGYLVTLANIQNFAASGGPLQDIAVRVSPLEVLAEELKHDSQFKPELFKDTGLYRVGNIGKYLSRNLREYLYNGGADPKEEGLILTLKFTGTEELRGRDGTDGALTMFMPRGEVTEEEDRAIEKHAMQEALDFYRPRSVRSLPPY